MTTQPLSPLTMLLSRHTRRREFITLVGGAAAWPLAARAQQEGKLPTIGLLGSGTAAAQSQWTTAFVQRLRELGWTEGRNLAIEYRWADGRTERLAEIADEFVRFKVDVILTHNTLPVLAAKQATSVIPIVFATAGDPVGTGIVASLSRPGGNVTGLSSQQPDTAGKRVDLLRGLIPGLRRLAVLADVDNPFTAMEIGEVQRAALTVGLEVARFEIRRAEDVALAFDALQGRAEALYVTPNPIMFVNRVRINTFALAARLPTMYLVREYVEAGGLMSYGPNWPGMWRRAAELVDKILRGAKPSGLPVEHQSGLMPANLITLPHLSVSSDMNFPKAADVIGIGSAPKANSRALIIGSARTALISLWSLSMIAAGVSLGAPSPYQPIASYPGTNSPTVGISGRASERVAPVTARARRVPA